MHWRSLGNSESERNLYRRSAADMRDRASSGNVLGIGAMGVGRAGKKCKVECGQRHVKHQAFQFFFSLVFFFQVSKNPKPKKPEYVFVSFSDVNKCDHLFFSKIF